jgi:non-specific serine/threonine protein kinase
LAAYALGAQGQYGHALERVQRGLEIAQEVEHQQWICLAHRHFGALYLDLLALPAARQHLEQTLALAKEIGSMFHGRLATGHLILVLILEQNLSQAEALLNTVFTPELAMQTMVQRWIWRARAELALAQGEPSLALQIIDRLFATAANMETRVTEAIPALAQLRGEALTALQRWAEAEATLRAAQATAHEQETPRLIWRLHVALGKLYQAQTRHTEAEQAFAAAHAIIKQLAATVPVPHLRDNFVRQANAMMSRPEPTTPLQAAKQTYAGLTRREREVAVLIAQGKSNRAIAEALVIGERTVEGYVSNMLNKLGFTSRAQIAAWTVEKGLQQDDPASPIA